MRVCLISREYPPDTGWGGIATFTKHLAHGLKQLGHDVEVIALADGPAKLADDDGIPVHRVAPYVVPGDLGVVSMCMPYSRTVLKCVSALWQKFVQLHQQHPFDVVDTPELLGEGIYPAVTRCLPLVIRLYTPHSKFMAEQLHNITASFDHQFVAMLERVAMLSADALTSPSEDLAEFVAKDLNYPQDQIAIIRNPIDCRTFCPDGDRALEDTAEQRVLFVGRLEERKGVNYLVHAIPAVLQACPNTQFVIIGADTINAADGQHSVLNQLRDFLARHQSLDKVKFITRVGLSELPSYYRSADVCVVPSVYDNSPYTCLEAMACGRPVIGTSAGGTKEYVLHGHSGLIVPPRDSESLSAAIITLLKDGKSRLQMGQSARQRVVDHFQGKEIARQTVGVYQKAIRNYQDSQGSKNALYRRPDDQALSDAAVLLYSFDRMMFDLLYRQSLRFRIRHWWRLGTSRPKLLVAKIMLRAAQLVTSRLPKTGKPAALLAWLEREVRCKQDDPLAALNKLAPSRPGTASSGADNPSSPHNGQAVTIDTAASDRSVSVHKSDPMH
jgi:glycosyltransferase involved in cell wall biosynthesis